MRILEKYVVKSYISSFLFCIILLMVLGIIGDVLGFMDEIFKNNIPLTSILSFYLYLAPFAFVNMVPFASLLSASYVFNSLSKNHEITAVIASGLSLWKLLRPILFVISIFCIITFYANDRFVPTTMKEANRIRHEELESSDKKKKEKIVKNLAIYGSGDRIIFAKSYYPKSKILENVIIHCQDKDHVIREKISASEIHYDKKDSKWHGHGVLIFQVDKDGNFEGDPVDYEEKIIDIKEKPEDFSSNQWDPKYMSYLQLSKYIKMFDFGSPETVRRFKVDLQYKLSFPFAAFVIVLICVPFSIETGRANALVGMVRGIALGMLYVPVMAISLALGKAGFMPPVLSAWFSNILFLLIGALFIHRKS